MLPAAPRSGPASARCARSADARRRGRAPCASPLRLISAHSWRSTALGPAAAGRWARAPCTRRRAARHRPRAASRSPGSAGEPAGVPAAKRGPRGARAHQSIIVMCAPPSERVAARAAFPAVRGDEPASAARTSERRAERVVVGRKGERTRPLSRTMSCAAATSTARVRQSVTKPSTRPAASWTRETAIVPRARMRCATSVRSAARFQRGSRTRWPRSPGASRGVARSGTPTGTGPVVEQSRPGRAARPIPRGRRRNESKT